MLCTLQTSIGPVGRLAFKNHENILYALHFQVRLEYGLGLGDKYLP